MFLQKFSRLENAVALFGCDECQFRSSAHDLVLDRLDPSHALNAVGSPRPPQEVRNQHAAPKESGKRQHAFAVGRFQRKFGSARSNFEIFSVIQHLESTVNQPKRRNNPGNAERTRGDTVEEKFSALQVRGMDVAVVTRHNRGQFDPL